MTALNKQAGAGDVSPKTYYIHPAAFGSTKDPSYGHVPVVKADDFEKLRAKLESAEKQNDELRLKCRLLDNADRDIDALRQRIAELEAREVTLPDERFRYGESDYDDGYVNGWNAHGIETKLALHAAGIGVNGE